ncbi:MAG TPA: glycosyltransferase family 39 protein, partial [Caldilineaceae bacterium]|nr:glycosyltransferase family 39 protein [Caldilineaceae bacterium]
MPRLIFPGAGHTSVGRAHSARTSSVRISTYFLLACIVIAGATLRFWHVNFDQGLGSHPDERSTSCFYATQIHLPQSWDEFWDPQRSPLNPLWDLGNQKPRSFTYGHYPLYLGVATGQLMHTLAPVAEQLGASESTVALMARADSSCDALAVAGRLTIAFHDILTILLLFLLGLRIFGQGAGLIAAAFYAFTAQAIQLSHFFAMDPASTTYTVLAVLGGVMMVQERSLRAAVITGIAAGLAVASKFSALPILAVPITAAILIVWQEQLLSRAEGRVADTRGQLYALLTIPLIFVLAGLTFFVTSPYAVLDRASFIQATLVEQGRMVRGIADFPFTRQYRNTTPYLYFLEQQLAWGLWWPLGLVTALGTIYALLQLLYSLLRLVVETLFRTPQGRPWVLSETQAANIVLWSWVVPYFGLTGAFLAKFNRYMSPVLPFAVFFAAGLIWTLWQGFRRERSDEQQEIQEIQEEMPAVDAEGPAAQRAETRQTTRPSQPAYRWLTRPIAVLLAVVGVVGGLFWSAAYVNGVYNEEHTWITASRWIAENVPAGSVILCEQWDDCLPWNVPNEPEVNAANGQLRRIDWGPYEEDTADKYEVLKAKLREADYVIYSSKRIYDSVDELPERYPMTTRYYAAMFDGSLGFALAKEVTTPPKLFGIVFDDRHADESWSLYDHAQVSIFRKVRDLSDAEYDAIFDHSWESAVPWYRGADSPLSPLLNRLGLGNAPESEGQGLINRIIAMASGQNTPARSFGDDRPSLRTAVPLAELPVVDNYRWNRTASENPVLAIVWWWFVLALLGWSAWPLAFWVFRPLRDRGYFLSRALGWLLAGWLLWWLASLDLAM